MPQPLESTEHVRTHDANQNSASQALSVEAHSHSHMSGGGNSDSAGRSDNAMQGALNSGLDSTASLYGNHQNNQFLPYRDQGDHPPTRLDPNTRSSGESDKLPRDTSTAPKDDPRRVPPDLIPPQRPPIIYYDRNN